MSHLDGQHLPEGDWRDPGVMDASQIDAIFGAAGAGVGGRPHGSVIRASDVEHRRTGGSQLSPQFEGGRERPGADPQQLPRNKPLGATVYQGQELPENDIRGHGFYGSRNQVNAAELDARDAAARGAYTGEGAPATPPHAQQQPPPPALRPGAYQRQDGYILLVHQDGRQLVLTPQQFQEISHQAQVPVPPAMTPNEGLTARLLRHLRGG